jgi:hypothetical protein
MIAESEPEEKVRDRRYTRGWSQMIERSPIIYTGSFQIFENSKNAVFPNPVSDPMILKRVALASSFHGNRARVLYSGNPMEHAHTSAVIEKMIYLVRGQKVMLDSDLAQLYEVKTGILNRAVRRHAGRFPPDFMFELNPGEHESLRCQLGTLKTGRGRHRKFLPLVFTEQGVAMLSSILTSDRAVSVNIAVIRTFVKLRQLVLEESLSERLTSLEKGTDQVFRVVFQRLDTLERSTPVLPQRRRKIGIKQD